MYVIERTYFLSCIGPLMFATHMHNVRFVCSSAKDTGTHRDKEKQNNVVHFIDARNTKRVMTSRGLEACCYVSS